MQFSQMTFKQQQEHTRKLSEKRSKGQSGKWARWVEHCENRFIKQRNK